MLKSDLVEPDLDDELAFEPIMKSGLYKWQFIDDWKNSFPCCNNSFQ